MDYQSRRLQERHEHLGLRNPTERAAVSQLLFDCTIPAAHIAVDLKGLPNGLHILEEKPLATNLADAK